MKKDNKFQITKAELQQIIKEEYASMAKDASRAEEIKARLEAINEELETLPETLSEVEAGGLKGVKSTGWTGAGEADKKYDEKFEKIGSHLKEDEEIEGEMELGGEEEAPEMGYFEMKFAELGRELDGKMSGETEEFGEEETEETEESEDDMGLNVDVEEVDEMVAEGIQEGETIEVDGDEEEALNEDLAEPIEGETPAQDSEARFNDYMEKDKHVKEGVQRGTTLLSEGKTPAQKSALDRELERMKALAKLR
jgi:hypothetical protein